MKQKLFIILLLFAGVFAAAHAQTPAALDPSFNPGSGASGPVRTIKIQSDGKVIIGGDFATYNGTARSRIARLNADGTLDMTFNPGSGANGIVTSAAVQSDGKIIIVGVFSTYNGTTRNYIARINADGTLDMGFTPGGPGANDYIMSTAIQSDGKILIGGDFTYYNGTARNRIARLNTDGSLDMTFNPGLGTDNRVGHIKLQSDGKILIGGTFTSYNGTARTRIARLNTDGSLDMTFNPGTGANSNIESIALPSGGKIIIGGTFTSYNGTARNYIARLNADGSLDMTFDPGTGASFYVHTTELQTDGKIVIGGQFTSYNGTARNRIARLNTDGSLDMSFVPGGGADNHIYSSALQPDGKIIIGGEFTTYGGTARNRIARVFLTGTCDINACIGDSLNFTPTVSGATYAWAFGDGGTSTAENPQHAYTSSGTFEVILTVTDSLGCSSSDTNTVCVHPAPSLTLTPINPGCYGYTDGSITSAVTGGAPGAGFTYLWSPGGATTSGITGLGAGTYSLTVTDPITTCTDTESATLTNPAAVDASFMISH